MFAKIEISGTIEIVTGLHIGGSSAFSAIGAVDSPVIMDTRTNQPMIPGSSLKGKMRALLAKQYNTAIAKTADDDAECLTNLFGSAKSKKESRVLFTDMFLDNLDELKRAGLHIGGSSAFSAIGAVDSPVIMDTRTNQPMIPGSSLKGKMRALLAKQYNTAIAKTADDDAECLTNLFGSAKSKKESRVLFTDMFLDNLDELKRAGLTGATEVKFENSISRTTAVANPRQIERVVRGAQFPMQLIYEYTDKIDEETLLQDFCILKEGLKLLEYDYLGGSGSRGYGRIKFLDLDAEPVIGDVGDELMEKCRTILEG